MTGMSGPDPDLAPAVTGKPLGWLRLDGFVLLAAVLILFAATHQPWWLVPAVILLPDLFMLGYLRGTRVGAAVYNLGHAYLLPAAMSLAGAVGHHPLTLALGLLWLGHIGMDRLARYGLKYDASFQHTHLGGPARARKTKEHDNRRAVLHRAVADRAAPRSTGSTNPLTTGAHPLRP